MGDRQPSRADLQAEVRALRARIERLERALRVGNVGIWDWDLATDTVRYSSQWKRQIGHEDHEIGDGFEEWRSRVHPDDLAPTMRRVQRMIDEAREGYDVEFRFRHADGSYRWIRAEGSVQPGDDGTPERVLGVHLDVTERKRHEAALRRRERELRQTLDATTDGIWSWDFVADELTFSDRYYRMLGYEPGAFPATFEGWRGLLHPDDRERAEAVAAAFLETKPDRYDNEFQLRTRSGDHRWIRARGRVVERDADGRALRMIGNHEDVTEERRLRAEKERLERRAERAHRLEAIGALAGGVAHDFNNQLTAINASAGLALETLADDDPAREDVEAVLEAGRHAAELTRQLLAFGSRQVMEPRPLDLDGVVTGMQRMLRRVIGEDIRIVSELHGDLGPVIADPAQVEQILVNLAINARDAMERGGTLTIRTGERELDEAHPWRRPEMSPGTYAELAVIDDGAGMDDETVARIFEPFFTTKELGRGTGLGLATVYGIVRQSGGHVEVRSRPGEGTTFQILLPLAEPGSGPAAAAPVQTTLSGSEAILLVEDEALVRQVIRRILASAGYDVIEAADGEQALALCGRHGASIRLVLSDVVMPGVRGPEIVERLREDLPGVPVLYMSGYPSDGTDPGGGPPPRERLLSKPFSRAELLRKVRQVLDEG